MAIVNMTVLKIRANISKHSTTFIHTLYMQSHFCHSNLITEFHGINKEDNLLFQFCVIRQLFWSDSRSVQKNLQNEKR